MKRYLHLAGFVACMGLTIASPALASAITASGALARVDSSGVNICLQDLNSFTPNSGAEANCIGNIAGGDFDIFASGRAAFGRLGVSMSVNNHRFPSTASYDADGFASFSDSVTIQTGSQAVFTFGITGNAGSVRFGRIGGVEHRVFAPGQQVSVVYDFTPGLRLDIGFALDADSLDSPASVGNCTPERFCDYYQLDDFADTAALLSVQVLDSGGKALANVAITSDSGFDYGSLISGPAPHPVPEPATVVLLAFGVLLPLMKRIARKLAPDRTDDTLTLRGSACLWAAAPFCCWTGAASDREGERNDSSAAFDHVRCSSHHA